MKKIILDLCGGSGNWSHYYRLNSDEYKVYVLDRQKNGTDIRLLMKQRERVYGILCAPPCTVFCQSGARWERTNWEMIEGLSIVDACIRICLVEQPTFWALENPRYGKLPKFLGEPQLIFQPCDYGDPYTKGTSLWGKFNLPKIQAVYPTLGSKMHTDVRNQSQRAETPLGFAKAFYLANR